MPRTALYPWLPLLRDPLDGETPLEAFAFADPAEIEPFEGREWGVLASGAGTLFPYFGTLVCFERTDEVTLLFERTRAELPQLGLDATHSLVGTNSPSAVDPGDGLFSPGQIDSYDETIVDAPLWQAIEQRVFGAWDSWMPDASAGPILDLGCGTGRCLREYSAKGFDVIGVDASYAMLRAAAASRGTENCLLILASATRLPLKNGSMAASTCFGTLHHLARPELALAELSRVLKQGAALLALEPNASPLRFLFDALSRACPLWEEEAGEGRLLSRRALLDSSAADWDWDFDYTVFVLPQLLSLLRRPEWIHAAIRASDLLGAIPGVRSLGGLLILTGRKKKR